MIISLDEKRYKFPSTENIKIRLMKEKTRGKSKLVEKLTSCTDTMIYINVAQILLMLALNTNQSMYMGLLSSSLSS
jgi:hypothetical protein